MKEDAKGSEKPSLVRSEKRTALHALTVTGDSDRNQAGDTQERLAEQTWPETLTKIKLLRKNDIQDTDFKGGKEESAQMELLSDPYSG